MAAIFHWNIRNDDWDKINVILPPSIESNAEFRPRVSLIYTNSDPK